MDYQEIEIISDVLTKSERSEFHRHELAIEDGVKSFVKVGAALFSIKEKFLYRESYDTFDEYVKDRWGMGRQYAYRLIRGSELAERFPELRTEAEARELNKVPFAEQDKVLERAMKTADMEGKNLSAVHIKLAAAEPSALTARPADVVEEPWDEDEQSDLWAAFFETLTDLQEICKRIAVHPEGCWFHTYADTLNSRIRDMTRIGEHTKPAGACPDCAGGIVLDCDTCRDRGWLPSGRLNALKKSKEKGVENSENDDK